MRGSFRDRSRDAAVQAVNTQRFSRRLASGRASRRANSRFWAKAGGVSMCSSGVGRKPSEFVRREKIKSIGAVLFVTAEYNRSVPAALKNALAAGSRPCGSTPGRPGRQ
jgi:hypothetical protein